MPRMVEVVIDSVRVSLTNQQRIVVLRELNTERYLPIWIGPYEAEAITIALQEIEVARPQTHDLMRNILKNLDAQLVRVEVLALRDDVFYGNLVVETNGMTVNIDSRPSDALALAVRTHVPILIALDVMDSAGVIPEQDI
ncbi:bifunctional nuclease family protein, partial [bacterium]